MLRPHHTLKAPDEIIDNISLLDQSQSCTLFSEIVCHSAYMLGRFCVVMLPVPASHTVYTF